MKNVFLFLLPNGYFDDFFAPGDEGWLQREVGRDGGGHADEDGSAFEQSGGDEEVGRKEERNG